MLAAILAGLFGLLIGSFLNACIFRFPRDITIWDPPRSFCPACEKTIAWYDNIPVLSFLLLRGKCRQCQYSIPIRYILVEILCGIMYFLIVYRFGPTLLAAKLALFGSINLELIATDFEERILPDEFTKGGIAAGLLLAWFHHLPVTFSSLVVPMATSLSIHLWSNPRWAPASGMGPFGPSAFCIASSAARKAWEWATSKWRQ